MATNNYLNLCEERRFAPLLAKVTALDPTPISTAQALWVATGMGGLAIHQPQLGIRAPGYKAEVLLLTLADTTLVPVFEDRTYIDHLVYASGRELVDSVSVNGVRVIKEGAVITVDEVAARRAAQQAAMAVLRHAEG